MFLDYSELLNALDSGASAKITINNRKVNKEEFEKSLLLPMREDGLDHYRKEYNEMLLSKVTRREQQRGTGPLHHHHRGQAEHRRSPHLFCPCRHRPHHPPFPAFLHRPRTGYRGAPADFPGFLQGERACRLCIRPEGTYEKGTQLQGLAVPRFDGIPERPFPPKRPLGACALPAGLRQLYQGFHDCRALRHEPQPHALHRYFSGSYRRSGAGNPEQAFRGGKRMPRIGSGNRMPPTTFPLSCPTIWSSSARKPRRCWRISPAGISG